MATVYVAPSRANRKAGLTGPSKMRIAFIHPDLGIGEPSPALPMTGSHLSARTDAFATSIGGAERLIVDAAVGLQKRGHDVEIFTSHHESGPTGRSFEETRDGE